MEKNNELELVNNQIAIQLKEIGFDWVCLDYYRPEGLVKFDVEIAMTSHRSYYHNSTSGNSTYSATTQELVIKWFRIIHDIHIEPAVAICVSEGIKLSNYYILYINAEEIKDKEYKSYEKAADDGIIKAIEILKNRNSENT